MLCMVVRLTRRLWSPRYDLALLGTHIWSALSHTQARNFWLILVATECRCRRYSLHGKRLVLVKLVGEQTLELSREGKLTFIVGDEIWGGADCIPSSLPRMNHKLSCWRISKLIYMKLECVSEPFQDRKRPCAVQGSTCSRILEILRGPEKQASGTWVFRWKKRNINKQVDVGGTILCLFLLRMITKRKRDSYCSIA